MVDDGGVKRISCAHTFERYKMLNLFFARGLFFTSDVDVEPIEDADAACTPVIVDPRILQPPNYYFTLKPPKKPENNKQDSGFM